MTTTEEQYTGRKARTRDRIMRALAEEVLQQGAHEMSVQGVADRAGVSHRTVYRYFPTKDELFQAYGAWLDGVLDTPESSTTSLDALPRGVVKTFEQFDRHPRLVEAYVRIQAVGQELYVREQRSAKFLGLVQAHTDLLDDEHSRALAAIVRQIANSQTWASAREAFGAEGRPLQEVSAWVVQTVVDAIERGDVPDEWNNGE